MNILRNLLSSTEKDDLVTIPSGVFYLKRSPISIKGPSECIFKDAIITLRKTSVPFNYQIVVQRVYEEGEESLDENEDDDSGIDDDERAFLLDASLKLSYSQNSDDQIIIVWKDLEGDKGDYFEFACDIKTEPKLFDKFDITARRCQYERKYQKSYQNASDSDLEEFDFDPDSVTVPPKLATSTKADTPKKQASPSTPVKTPKSESKSKSAPKTPKSPAIQSFDAKPAITEIEKIDGEKLYSSKASLHLFDAPTGVFIEQLAKSDVSIYDLGKFEYWLEVDSDKNRFIGLIINNDMNPVFNYEHLSFIFNFFAEGSAFSWLLKFDSFESLEKFQEVFVQSLWESNNRTKWGKVKDDEREYLADAFQDLNMSDYEDATEGFDEDEPEEEDEEEEGKGLTYGDGEADYDEDEDYEEEQQKRMSGKGINKELAVGHVNDRTYVVRDNMLGVFKQTEFNDLEFQTTIANISDLKGKTFSPDKIMLHTKDRSMILQDKDNSGSLYRMDLEYGKVVDEWSAGNHEIRAFAPSEKFAQSTDEETVVGASDNGVFRLDPRLSGSKLVDSQTKKYATKMNFTAIDTTEKGYIAVANRKGEIRLYDRLGINAKTHLPAMGDEIIGIQTSSDGRWILATCKTYLLLIDASQKDGKTGFQKSFGKDVKPRPRRLQISPEHLAQMQMETGKPLSFTSAKFNIGVDTKEQSIVTSSGPFLITWSLKKLFRNDKTPYLIKRYTDNVTAENFKYGTDKNVIIALEDDVGMVSKRSLRLPTRESLATPARRVQAMSRRSIVNSPF